MATTLAILTYFECQKGFHTLNILSCDKSLMTNLLGCKITNSMEFARTCYARAHRSPAAAAAAAYKLREE